MTTYPGAIDAFDRKIAGFSEVRAADINELQIAIEAIQAELGVDPAGTEATVAIRLDALETSIPEVPEIVGVINIILGNGLTVVSTGIKGYLEIPYNCEIQSVRLVGDVSGSIVVDIWKDSYANFPPTVADTITASAKPTLSSAQKAEDTTLTGWTKALAAGDWLAFNVDSAATVKLVTLSLLVRRT